MYAYYISRLSSLRMQWLHDSNSRNRKFGNALITFAASKSNFRSSMREYSGIITFPSWPAFHETNLNAIKRFIQTSYVD